MKRKPQKLQLHNALLPVILVAGLIVISLTLLQENQAANIAGNLATTGGLQPDDKADLFPRLVGAIPTSEQKVYHVPGGANLEMQMAPDQRPVIVHVESDGQINTVSKTRVVFTRCTDRDCPKSSSIPITAYGSYSNPSVAFSPVTGLPAIAYFETITAHETRLWVFACATLDCSGQGTTKMVTDKILSSSRNNPDIVFLPSGELLLAYGGPSLKPTVTVCQDASCSTVLSETSLDTTLSMYPRIALPPDGKPIVVYATQGQPGLRAVKCGDSTCSSGNSQPIVLDTVTSFFVSLAVPPDQNPVISYQAQSKLRMVRCGNPSCSSGNSVTVVDSSFFSGGNTDIAIASDGHPVISYNKATLSSYGWALWIADCGDKTCNPNDAGFKSQELYKAKQADSGGFGDAGHGTAILVDGENKLVAQGVIFYQGDAGARMLLTVHCKGSLPCQVDSTPSSLYMVGIKNKGVGSTNGPFQVQFQSPAVKTTKVTEILTSTNSEWEKFVTVPSNQLPPSTFTVQVFVDSNNNVGESDESNNIGQKVV